jgi:hypothetical protein
MWFEIIIIFKDETLNLHRIRTLSKLMFIKNDKKKHVMYLDNYKHLL